MLRPLEVGVAGSERCPLTPPRAYNTVQLLEVLGVLLALNDDLLDHVDRIAVSQRFTNGRPFRDDPVDGPSAHVRLGGDRLDLPPLRPSPDDQRIAERLLRRGQ